MAVGATGQQWQQQVPWNPQKQDADEDNMVVAVEDVKLAEPQHRTGGHHLSNVSKTQQIYITTVTENKQKYSQSDVKREDGVRALPENLGHPTARHLSYLLDHHLIPNSLFTSHDVRRAEQIYSPDLGNLKGKTT